MKKIVIASAAILLVIAVLIWGVNIQSTKEHDKEVQEQTAATEEANAKKVTMSISCAQVLDHYDELDESLKDEKYVPEDGVILPAAEYTVQEGETAFDLLQRITDEKKLQMEYVGAEQSSFGSAYIKSINHLYEGSCGQYSGWVFTVNGEYTEEGCSQYQLKDQDVIEWVYSCGDDWE